MYGAREVGVADPPSHPHFRPTTPYGTHAGKTLPVGRLDDHCSHRGIMLLLCAKEPSYRRSVCGDRLSEGMMVVELAELVELELRGAMTKQARIRDLSQRWHMKRGTANVRERGTFTQEKKVGKEKAFFIADYLDLNNV